jgi:hypothetical protein
MAGLSKQAMNRRIKEVNHTVASPGAYLVDTIPAFKILLGFLGRSSTKQNSSTEIDLF